MSTIYVIALNTEHSDETIDPDYGYFTDKAEAEAFVESLDKPEREKYEEHLAHYNKELAAHQAKAEEARKLGFTHEFHLYHPWKPDYHTVIAIQPGNVKS